MRNNNPPLSLSLLIIPLLSLSFSHTHSLTHSSRAPYTIPLLRPQPFLKSKKRERADLSSFALSADFSSPLCPPACSLPFLPACLAQRGQLCTLCSSFPLSAEEGRCAEERDEKARTLRLGVWLELKFRGHCSFSLSLPLSASVLALLRRRPSDTPRQRTETAAGRSRCGYGRPCLAFLPNPPCSSRLVFAVSLAAGSPRTPSRPLLPQGSATRLGPETLKVSQPPDHGESLSPTPPLILSFHSPHRRCAKQPTSARLSLHCREHHGITTVPHLRGAAFALSPCPPCPRAPPLRSGEASLPARGAARPRASGPSRAAACLARAPP